MFSRNLTLLLVLVSSSVLSLCYSYSLSPGIVHDLRNHDQKDLDWWQNAVFYQIYPRSFKDSDADGIGDLKGIISKLPYLKESGITATWLSPIFESPGVDQGYDISNYRKIDPIFGTMEDFNQLIKDAKKLGLKIILDFVPNHTSNQHEWFLKSLNKTEGFEDFYIWKDGDPSTPPNNWISEFSGRAWSWSEDRGQWYYHQFAPQQPDLNYNNPKVVEEMKSILNFWLDKGIDGFRMDAVPYLFEDPSFRDAPPARGYQECLYLSHCQDKTLLMADLDKTYDMIYQFREHIDEYVDKNNLSEPIVIMTEAYTSVENTMLYYQSQDGTRNGGHFSFNFNFIVYLKTNFTLDHISNAINKWLVYLPKGLTSNWVLGNHDNNRVASRLGQDNVDGFNMLIAFLPGVMVTYNGEEIGMLDGEVNCETGKDPSAIKNCTTFDSVSRDFERTPFQWDNSTYAGFSTVDPWLPVGSSKDYINLEAQNDTNVNNTHYKIYKRLLQFRTKFKNVTDIDYLAVIKVSDTILQVVRQRDNNEYVYLFNIGNDHESVVFYKKSGKYSVEVASSNSDLQVGDTVSGTLVMKPHEGLILHGIKGSSGATSTVFSLALVVLLNLVCYLL